VGSEVHIPCGCGGKKGGKKGVKGKGKKGVKGRKLEEEGEDFAVLIVLTEPELVELEGEETEVEGAEPRELKGDKLKKVKGGKVKKGKHTGYALTHYEVMTPCGCGKHRHLVGLGGVSGEPIMIEPRMLGGKKVDHGGLAVGSEVHIPCGCGGKKGGKGKGMKGGKGKGKKGVKGKGRKLEEEGELEYDEEYDEDSEEYSEEYDEEYDEEYGEIEYSPTTNVYAPTTVGSVWPYRSRVVVRRPVAAVRPPVVRPRPVRRWLDEDVVGDIVEDVGEDVVEDVDDDIVEDVEAFEESEETRDLYITPYKPYNHVGYGYGYGTPRYGYPRYGYPRYGYGRRY